MKFWDSFAQKHPAAAQWVREGGSFVIVSNAITVLKWWNGNHALLLSRRARMAGRLSAINCCMEESYSTCR